MRLSILICLVANLCTFHFSNTNAQNLAISSGYSNILNIFTINVIDEVLTKVGEQEVEPNFTFLEIGADGQSVYFVHEVTEYGDFGETGAVSFWRKGRDISGNVLFQKMETMPSGGTGTCHVKLHAEYGLLYVANYAGGSFTAIQINKETGGFMDRAYNEFYGMGSNVKPDRQEMAHAHEVMTYGEFVYVVDLGSDKIWHYKASGDGAIIKSDPEYTSVPPGYGPRHIVFSKNLKKAYVVFELESVVGVYDVDEATGALTEFQIVPLMPDTAPEDFAAEIELNPSEKQLYVSNRARGALVVYNVMADGGLDQFQVLFTCCPNPRHFKIHPSGKFLLVAYQDSDKIEKYSIDPNSGFIDEQPVSIESANKPTIIGLLNL